MDKYMVDYGTGAGNSYHGTIEGAKTAAASGMTYTQQSVKIIDTDTNEVVAISHWWSVNPDDDSDVLRQFGDFGYYAEWDNQ